MDKTEYQEKLDELQEYLRIKDYESAYALVNSIDWRKVKSTRTLNMVADVYEVNKDYEKCRKILTIALGRASIGKSILYRLTEVCIKQRDIKSAQDYYRQYAKLAPRDNAKLLLEYKLARAVNQPIDEQIRILEEYKEREYTERWAYELALLYSRAGETSKCVEACDDMILWFSEGKYVLKAMELKKRYAELSPSQQLYYEKEQKDSDARLVFSRQEREAAQERRPAAKGSVIDRLNAAGAEAAKDVSVDNTGVLPVTNEELDSYSVTSRQFIGSKPDLKTQLEKSIKSVYAGVKEAPKVEAPKPLSTSEFSVDDIIKETQAGFSDVAARKEEFTAEEAVKDTEPEAEIVVTVEEGAAAEAVRETAVPVETPVETAEETAEIVVEAVEEAAEPEAEEPAAEPEAEEPAEETAAEAEAAEGAVEPEAEEPVEETAAEAAAGPETEEPVEETAAEPEVEEPAAEAAAEPKKEAETAAVKEEPAPAPKKPQIIYDDREIPDPEPSPEERRTHTLPLDKIGQNTVPISIEEVLRNETPDERRIRILNNAAPTRMNAQQREIFTYFARIPGMDTQILEAMTHVYEHAGEHTSRRGNIAVMGAVGTGKSRLSDGLITAMCQDMQLDVAKTARVSGERMNMLDPAKVVSRMSGGFLVIENASDMSSKTVEKLNQAMEFRTDCMILIAEDEKTAMRSFMKRYPDFAEKLSGQISIPVFTNDELVTFARTYCAENNCQMDELGVLALYSIISNGQSEEQPMTISEVKNIIDGAMSRAKRGGRRGRKSSSREKIVTLYEKDFAQ